MLHLCISIGDLEVRLKVRSVFLLLNQCVSYPKRLAAMPWLSNELQWSLLIHSRLRMPSDSGIETLLFISFKTPN